MINNIEIINYKCFDNFKADGFKRVNLIGGKNNVGKTSFMEACLICSAESHGDIYHKLREIKTHRNLINNILAGIKRQEDIQKLIIENQNLHIKCNNEDVYIKVIDELYNLKIIGEPLKKIDYSTLFNTLDQNIQYSFMSFTLSYISAFSDFNEMYNMAISQLKLDNKLELLNEYLNKMFDISKIDTINDEPYVMINSWVKLSDTGQGIKTFINIIFSMFILKNRTLFIDEIENGIHYSLFDDFWEIILKLSQERNIQVFATTHSKECIESYNRVSLKLNDEDTVYFEMAKNKKTKKIFMRNLDNEQLDYELTHQGRYRGE
ncbi:MAG: AAA family ATPase [Campylobacterota bacterium]|nr:AAA family ATPase [Campylobacterota bacterium]